MNSRTLGSLIISKGDRMTVNKDDCIATTNDGLEAAAYHYRDCSEEEFCLHYLDEGT
jgi:hypothetical protein